MTQCTGVAVIMPCVNVTIVMPYHSVYNDDVCSYFNAL